MRYNGGKSVVGKRFAEVINLWGKDKRTYIEPFVGSAWVTIHIDHPHRYCYDVNPYLIAMWRKLQKGWVPPEKVTKGDYDSARFGGPDHLRAFIGFGCSWGGKWFGGYNIENDGEAPGQASRSLLRKIQHLQDVGFDCRDYRDLSPEQSIIYCDPPYADSTEAWGDSEPFDHKLFWRMMRLWAKLGGGSNIVIISSYEAPADFIQIADFPDVRVVSANRGDLSRTEKLWLAPCIVSSAHSRPPGAKSAGGNCTT